MAVEHNGQASLRVLRAETWMSVVTRLLSNLTAQDCQPVLQFSRNSLGLRLPGCWVFRIQRVTSISRCCDRGWLVRDLRLWQPTKSLGRFASSVRMSPCSLLISNHDVSNKLLSPSRTCWRLFLFASFRVLLLNSLCNIPKCAHCRATVMGQIN